MKKAAAKGNKQKNKKEKERGFRKTQTERKQRCAIDSSAVQDPETSGVEGLNNALQSRKKSTGLKVVRKGIGSVSRNRTPAKNTCQKSGVVTWGLKKATKHNPPPKTVPTGGGGDEHLRNQRDETESSEEESESTAGSSEEVREEQISDEEEEEHDGRKESSEGDGSGDTEPSAVQGTTKGTAVNRFDKDSLGESKCSRSSELNTSRIEEETRVDPTSADESQGKDVSQEDTSESLAAGIRRRRPQPSCTTKAANQSKYKMFKRCKAEKQAEKDEKRRVKAEKQRLEKEAKQKAKEEKKNKKEVEKHAKEVQSTGHSHRRYHKAKEKNKSAKPTKNPEDDSCGKAHMSEVWREEDDEDESALTKAIKGQNRFMHLKEKGKDFKHLLARPEEETSGEPLGLESNKVRQRLVAQRKGATTFNKVSAWIQKNVPQKLTFRKRLSAWTKAMGISRWLSLKVSKQNQTPKKSKRAIVQHRMALRVASKTSLFSKNKMAKEKSGEGGGTVVPAGEKDTEAKYAVVLPRMNGLKTKTVETSQAAPSLSAHSNMTESPGESSSAESRPPKPGARLVLPVKPDLSLLKSIRKSLQGDVSPGAGLPPRTPNSSQIPEGSLKTGETKRKEALENPQGLGVLQAASRELDPSHTNQTKLALSGGTIGPTRARGPEPERDLAAGIPRSSSQPFPNGEAGSGLSGAGQVCDEETDREVAQLMCEGGKYGANQPEVHWAGNPQMSGDPQVRFLILSLFNLLCDAPVDCLSLSGEGLAPA